MKDRIGVVKEEELPSEQSSGALTAVNRGIHHPLQLQIEKPNIYKRTEQGLLSLVQYFGKQMRAGNSRL